MTRVDSTIVAQYSYDAWGNVLSAMGPLAAINPIRYRGYYWDAETGWYYCQSRYYNPQWCRWISSDAFMDTGTGIQGTNMYAYCRNNPMMRVDPAGYFDTRVHTGYTRDWAFDFLKNYFDPVIAWDYATILAAANQMVDDVPTSPTKNWYNPDAQAFHFNTNRKLNLDPFNIAGSDNDSRVQIYNAFMNAAINQMSTPTTDKDATIKGALQTMGIALHAAQDIITHNGINDISVLGGITHLHLKPPRIKIGDRDFILDYYNPDAPTPERLRIAKIITEQTLRVFIIVGKANSLF